MERSYSFINRDISWLRFNERVLDEAACNTVQTGSRFLFLSIYSSNLDEFYRVRMPVIRALGRLKNKKFVPEQEYPAGLAAAIQETVQVQLEKFGTILREQLLPALQANGIRLCYNEALPAVHKLPVLHYFNTTVAAYLQPVGLDNRVPGSVFLENNALYLLVKLTGQPDGNFQLVNIPSAKLPRFRHFRNETEPVTIVFLDDIIRECLPVLFPESVIEGAWSLKLTRDAELHLEDEFDGDIAEKIERQLEKRDAGPATRLLVDAAAPVDVRVFIRNFFQANAGEMVNGGRYHHLRDLAALPLAEAGLQPPDNLPAFPHPGFPDTVSVFSCISNGNKLLHLPYQQYDPVLRFFSESAIDKQVKAIYITLYRVAPESHIVHALMSAAKNGKQVTVFVELKARFDEANNLKWSKRMKAAGVRIIQSLPRLKVHAKVALVQREENGQLRNYAYMGTGNFNESTARFYTDHGYFTADEKTGQELQALFSFLQVKKQAVAAIQPPEFTSLLVSQFNMIRVFSNLIQAEIQRARSGEHAAITIKLNNLQEREMISLLYAASNAGVQIQLLVRGICCLAPGVPGQSENIRVIRIVDRFLEHARVVVFHNGGNPLYFLGSADWMNRNLHSRIEVCFPVQDAMLKDELRQLLVMQLLDSEKAVELTADGNYRSITSTTVQYRAQQQIYDWIKQEKTG